MIDAIVNAAVMVGGIVLAVIGIVGGAYLFWLNHKSNKRFPMKKPALPRIIDTPSATSRENPIRQRRMKL